MSKLLDFILPTPCIFCAKLGAPLCKLCKESYTPNFKTMELSGVTGFSVSEYDQQSALMVNAIKETGLTSLIPDVAAIMIANWPKDFEDVVLVPIPSSKSNNKKRGYSHTSLMAKQLVRRLPNCSYRELLRSAKPRLDQVGLSTKERTVNMKDVFNADLRGFRSKGAKLVLVDDVVTSGATLSEAIRCLEAEGLRPAGFAVFARAGAH